MSRQEGTEMRVPQRQLGLLLAPAEAVSLLLLLLLLHDRRPGEGGGGGARAVAETVQHFITAMDSLKLNLVAVDQVG